MRHKFLFIAIRLTVIVSFAAIFAACASAKKDEKFYERQEKKQSKLEQQDYEKRVKQHRKLQSESTLKMMKQSEKESKKLNKYKKR